MDSFNKLKELVSQGQHIALFDYDGYYHYGQGMSLDDVIYNSRRKMGHSFVLLGMLTNDLFWRKKYNSKNIKSLSVSKLKI